MTAADVRQPESPPPTQRAATAQPLRPVDQARAMGLSEAEWLVAHAPAMVRALTLPAADFIHRLPPLGTVMALTRNAHCVHEKDGAFGAIEIDGTTGLVLNHDIDLRLFLSHWVHLFAVETPLENGGVRQSFQVFDAAGRAVHKLFRRPATDAAAWDRLVADHAAPDRPARLEIVPAATRPADRPDPEIDLSALRAGWESLRDVHDFFALLRRQEVGRLQAMRLAGAPYARPLAPRAVETLLERAAARAVPLMVFVANPGCIQIHTGPIQHVRRMGPWLNILDPGFNLHLRLDEVAHAFVVWKPQADAAVHSVELFAADGTLICQLFGERKPGRPELAEWVGLLQDVAAA
jgi:putative hemin transport protein